MRLKRKKTHKKGLQRSFSIAKKPLFAIRWAEFARYETICHQCYPAKVTVRGPFGRYFWLNGQCRHSYGVLINAKRAGSVPQRGESESALLLLIVSVGPDSRYGSFAPQLVVDQLSPHCRQLICVGGITRHVPVGIWIAR